MKEGRAKAFFFNHLWLAQMTVKRLNENPERSISVWPGPSIKYPYFFEEVTYWFE